MSEKPRLHTIRCRSKLPTAWVGRSRKTGIVAQGDLRVNRGRLRAKCLVFDSRKHLRAFWRTRLGHDLGAGCLGAVNSLGRMTEMVGGPRDGRRVYEVDRRYFCVIGLVRGYLTMRILSHESVHAAFAFVKRKSRNEWDRHAIAFDEEAVAYPVGEIARATVSFLNRAGLLADGSSEPARARKPK